MIAVLCDILEGTFNCQYESIPNVTRTDSLVSERPENDIGTRTIFKLYSYDYKVPILCGSGI